jgi:hypothetical protein
MAYLPDNNENLKTEDSTVSDLWAWLLQNQKAGREAEKFKPTDDGLVRWAGKEVLLLPDEKTGKITGESVKYESDYTYALRAMPVKERKAAQIALKKAGFLPANYVANGLLSDPDFINASLLLARQISSANFAMARDSGAMIQGRDPMTMSEYLRLAAKQSGGLGGTSVQRNITSFTGAESRGILESFYGEALGRRPTDKEVASFQKALNTAAQRNPTVTTSTTSGDVTTSKSSGGFNQADAELKARNMAEKQVGAAGYMSSTKYMDAFMNVLNKGRSEF